MKVYKPPKKSQKQNGYPHVYYVGQGSIMHIIVTSTKRQRRGEQGFENCIFVSGVQSLIRVEKVAAPLAGYVVRKRKRVSVNFPTTYPYMNFM